jgi:hypothetical protein
MGAMVWMGPAAVDAIVATLARAVKRIPSFFAFFAAFAVDCFPICLPSVFIEWTRNHDPVS